MRSTEVRHCGTEPAYGFAGRECTPSWKPSPTLHTRPYPPTPLLPHPRYSHSVARRLSVEASREAGRGTGLA
eukprot:2244658-Rhodomonas_salina.1